MSLGKLIASTILDLFLVLLAGCAGILGYCFTIAPTPLAGMLRVGQALGLPLAEDPGSRHWRYVLSLECAAVPDDDGALADWLRTERGVLGVRIQRQPLAGEAQGETQLIRANLVARAGLSRPAVPWDRLGYRAGAPTPQIWWSQVAPGLAFNPTDRELVLLCVGSLQVGLLFVGLGRMRANGKLPVPAAWEARDPAADEEEEEARPGEARPVVAGIVTGLILGALYWSADQALLHFWGPQQALSRCWLCIPSVGWNVPHDVLPAFWRDVDPHIVVLGILGGAVSVFPLAQVVFFCGGLLRMWSASGRVWLGMALATLLMGVVALDWHFLPVSVLLAVPVLLLYHWLRGLLAPLLAMAVLSLAIIGTTFGALPGLSHPSNQIIGEWALVGRPQIEIQGFSNPSRSRPLRFRRGGALQNGRTVEGNDQRKILRDPQVYRWLDWDHIRVTTSNEAFDWVAKTNLSVTDDMDYRVTIGRDELILTRIPDGKVFRYYRYR